MKTSIFSRIFGAIVLVSFIAVSIVSVLTLNEQVKVFEESVIREKITLLRFLQAASTRSEVDEFIPELILYEVETSGNLSFFWIVDENDVIYYADEKRLEGNEIEDPFVGVSKISSRRASYGEREVEVVAAPVTGINEEKWTAILGINMAEISSFILTSSFRVLVIMLFATLVSIFLSLALTEKIIAPLLHLRKAISEIGKGKLDQKVDIKTGDEVEEIGEEFNEMTNKLKENRKELEEAKKVLEVRVQARTKELEQLANNLEEQVEARTQELQRKVEELEKFHKLTVGREKKMIELKEKNKKLKREIEELQNKIEN